MKIFRISILLFGLMFTMGTYTSCSEKKDKSLESVETGKEYTSKLICPMHCEGSGSHETGICPVCGMDYVKNEKHKADGHQHDNHEGHNH